jgi:hypothetical protein
MTLHFSHIGLTDGRTFMISFRWSGDRALAAGTAAATWSRIRPQTSRLRAGQSMVSTRRALRGSPAPGREGTTCRRRGWPGAHARSHTSPRAAGSPAPAGARAPHADSGIAGRPRAEPHIAPCSGFASAGGGAGTTRRQRDRRAPTREPRDPRGGVLASAGRGGRAGTGRHWTPATGSPTLRRQSNSAPAARQRRPARLRRPRRHADARGSAHGGRWQ